MALAVPGSREPSPSGRPERAAVLASEIPHAEHQVWPRRQDGGMDPVAALNEIAFRLERELAPSFKFQAFRRAAVAIAELSPEELAARAKDGRLKSMKGIG